MSNPMLLALRYTSFLHFPTYDLRPQQISQLKAIQMDPRRVPALILAEIAFLLSLPSADTSISTMAAKGLRSLAHAERQANVPISTIMSDEDRSKRDPVYEQLGDPRVTVVGMFVFLVC